MQHLVISEELTQKAFEKALDDDMRRHVTHFEQDLAKVRTGRAHPSLVEDIRVNCYGSMMPIRELGSVTAADAQNILIQPWDVSVLADIEKAILQSDVGITPRNDGKSLRLTLPPMSAARRDELVKAIHKRAEECRIAIRNVRKDVNNILRDAEKGKKVSEDSAKRLQVSLQKVTDALVAHIDAAVDKKEREIRSL